MIWSDVVNEYLPMVAGAVMGSSIAVVVRSDRDRKGTLARMFVAGTLFSLLFTVASLRAAGVLQDQQSTFYAAGALGITGFIGLKILFSDRAEKWFTNKLFKFLDKITGGRSDD